jgi:hypothetical protein
MLLQLDTTVSEDNNLNLHDREIKKIRTFIIPSRNSASGQYCIVTYKGFAWLIIMGSGFDVWIYWHFFTITVNYKNSHIELLLNAVWRTAKKNLANHGLICTLLWSLYCFWTKVAQLIVLCYPVGCHGNLVCSNSFASIHCNVNVISVSCSATDVWL